MSMAKQTAPGKKINAKKFAMWIAIGSIIMMFGGFTSAYIVRQGQGGWLKFDLPFIFYVSTAAILLSSLTLWLAVRSFKQRKMILHKRLVVLTVLLGIAFAVLQYIGFKQLFAHISWSNNVAFQYIIVIIGMHALHVIGGVIALIVMFARTFNNRLKIYSSTGLEIISTYWHFVDILWIYLLVFFLITL
jgi:cytochrome c oxidase subunit 3